MLICIREGLKVPPCSAEPQASPSLSLSIHIYKHMYIPCDVPSCKRLQNYGKIHHFQWVNPLFLWPFSIAMQQITRGYAFGATCHVSQLMPWCIPARSRARRGVSSWLNVWTDAWTKMFKAAFCSTHISHVYIWLVVFSPPLWTNQMGFLFPMYGKIEHVSNHQSDMCVYIYTFKVGQTRILYIIFYIH